MLKLVGANKKTGTKIVWLGLSRRNCELLLEGKPIVIPLDEMLPDVDVEIILLGGETELAMVAEFKKAGKIGPQVKINVMHPDDPHAN